MAIRASDVPLEQHNKDRLRRADSWLTRSADASSDDERFILLWIAFNAAYGTEVPGERNQDPTESEKFKDFLRRILDCDREKQIGKIVWEKFSSQLGGLIDNKFVFRPFWQWVRGEPTGENWGEWFDRDKLNVHRQLDDGDLFGILVAVFQRLYTLRNQIFHGGATFASGWGRRQVEDGSRIMEALVPAILDIMRADIDANANSDRWGPVSFPRCEKPD